MVWFVVKEILKLLVSFLLFYALSVWLHNYPIFHAFILMGLYSVSDRVFRNEKNIDLRIKEELKIEQHLDVIEQKLFDLELKLERLDDELSEKATYDCVLKEDLANRKALGQGIQELDKKLSEHRQVIEKICQHLKNKP